MYQTFMSQLLAELPMHLVVFACGVFGYVSTLLVSQYLLKLRVASQAAVERCRLSSELDELRQELQESQVVREKPRPAPLVDTTPTQDTDSEACVEEANACQFVAPEVAASPVVGPQVAQLQHIPECSEVIVQAEHQLPMMELPTSASSYGPEAAELSTADEGLSSSWEAVSTDDSWEEEEEQVEEPEALEAQMLESPQQGYESAPAVAWSMHGAAPWQMGADLQMPAATTQHFESKAALPWIGCLQDQAIAPLMVAGPPPRVDAPDDGWMLSMDELLQQRAATMAMIW